MCEVKTFPIPYNCVMSAHSFFVHNMNMMNCEITIPPEDCQEAAKKNQKKSQ